MPYEWTKSEADAPNAALRLWPHQSMTAHGFVWFFGLTAALIAVPLFSVLGTVILWGLLPFMLMTLGLLWVLIMRNKADRSVNEVLTITPSETHLRRRNPRGASDQTWDCNTYWVQVNLHETNPQVPHYVTLTGNGREVEVGAFLTDEERLTLHEELTERFSDMRRATHQNA